MRSYLFGLFWISMVLGITRADQLVASHGLAVTAGAGGGSSASPAPGDGGVAPIPCPEGCHGHGTCEVAGKCKCTGNYCGLTCEAEINKDGKCSYLCVKVKADKVKDCTDGQCYKCSVTNDCYHGRMVKVHCATTSDHSSDGNNVDNPDDYVTTPIPPVSTVEVATCALPCQIFDTHSWDDKNAFKSADVAIIIVGMCLLIGFGGAACFLCFILRGGRFHRRTTSTKKHGMHDDDREFEELQLAAEYDSEDIATDDDDNNVQG